MTDNDLNLPEMKSSAGTYEKIELTSPWVLGSFMQILKVIGTDNTLYYLPVVNQIVLSHACNSIEEACSLAREHIVGCINKYMLVVSQNPDLEKAVSFEIGADQSTENRGEDYHD